MLTTAMKLPTYVLLFRDMLDASFLGFEGVLGGGSRVSYLQNFSK